MRLTTSLVVTACFLARQNQRVGCRGRRRKVTVLLALIEACLVVSLDHPIELLRSAFSQAGSERFLQVVSVVAMLIPNVYNLVRFCSWFDKEVGSGIFVVWTCWNCLFMLFVINARNTSFWRRKGEIRVRLVMQGSLLTGAGQTSFSLTQAKLWSRMAGS